MASWDVFRELDSLRREMDEAFRSVGMSRPFASAFLAPATARRFPLVNVSEDDGHVFVEALLPGVEPKETNLSVLGNTVTISGERKPFHEQRGQVVHRSELGSGKFSRTLELPTDINPDNINAEYRDGVLRVSLAKAEHIKPKRIEIGVS